MRAGFGAGVVGLALAVLSTSHAGAQEKGTLSPKALPPLSNPSDPRLPAKALFGRELTPLEAQARSIGFYARGCLIGAKALPVNGSTWQVMRLSRNRNWANPALIDVLERFANSVPSINGWPGILVGDISQPRGGPMITGHSSHQVGLDADVWLTPMPKRELSREEREMMSATNVVRDDQLDVDRRKWTPGHMELVKAAAEMPEVDRIFVNPAIKKAMCRDAGSDRAWLHKVRPIYGHNYHFHIRIKCPSGDGTCQPQDPIPPGDGCDASLAYWFTDAVLHPKSHPSRPKPPLTLAQLPAACRQVVLSK